MHHPGIEPRAIAWKATMLPLHQWCYIPCHVGVDTTHCDIHDVHTYTHNNSQLTTTLPHNHLIYITSNPPTHNKANNTSCHSQSKTSHLPSCTSLKATNESNQINWGYTRYYQIPSHNQYTKNPSINTLSLMIDDVPIDTSCILKTALELYSFS
jgi:hypothetical protein